MDRPRITPRPVFVGGMSEDEVASDEGVASGQHDLEIGCCVAVDVAFHIGLAAHDIAAELAGRGEGARPDVGESIIAVAASQLDSVNAAEPDEVSFGAAEVENAVIVAIICDRGDRYLSTGVFSGV